MGKPQQFHFMLYYSEENTPFTQCPFETHTFNAVDHLPSPSSITQPGEAEFFTRLPLQVQTLETNQTKPQNPPSSSTLKQLSVVKDVLKMLKPILRTIISNT